MKDIEKVKQFMLNEARLLHERAYLIEGACDAIQLLTNSDRFGSTAIISSKATLRKWLDEYPSDKLPIVDEAGGDK